MAEKLFCPVWGDVWEGSPSAGGKRVRRQCGKIADEYIVKGESYSTRQVLCIKHKLKAELEGFVLQPVETSVDSVHNVQQRA